MDAMQASADAIRELRARQRRRDELDACIEELRVRIEYLAAEASAAEQTARRERDDVDKLEHLSGRRLWETLKGTRDIALTKEQSEATRATRLASEAQARVDEATAEMQRLLDEYCSLGDVQGCMQTALDARAGAILAAGSPNASRLTEFTDQLRHAEAMQREYDEAYAAGVEAVRRIDEVVTQLSSARNWSTYDTFLGGGLIASTIKHGKMDDASALARNASNALARFTAELGDIGMGAVMASLDISPGQRMFDQWFDNIFSDLSVHDRVRQAQDAADHASRVTREMLAEVAARRSANERQIAVLAVKRRALLEDGI